MRLRFNQPSPGGSQQVWSTADLLQQAVSASLQTSDWALSPLGTVTQEVATPIDWGQIHDRLGGVIAVGRFLDAASRASGGYVRLSQDCHCIPYLVGTNQQRIPMMRFVEVIDEVVDFDDIKEELPELSYAQISGALGFLRKVCQFNSAGRDLDEDDAEAEASDPLFWDSIRRALDDEETARVLYLDQSNR